MTAIPGRASLAVQIAFAEKHVTIALMTTSVAQGKSAVTVIASRIAITQITPCGVEELSQAP